MADLGVLDPRLYETGDPWFGSLPLDQFARLPDEPSFIDGAWIVTRHADVSAILHDPVRFSAKSGTSVRRLDPTVVERGGKPTMVSMDGTEHHRNRTVTSRMFSPKAVKAFEQHFRAIAVRIIERALDMERIDFIYDLARYMPLDAISDMIGIPPEDREQVLAWTDMTSVPLDPHYTPSREEFMAALDGLWAYGVKLADRRQREPDDGIMTAIARGRFDGRLSDDEVSGYMLQLAAAGNETTRNAIALGLHALLQRPEQMALLRGYGGAMPEAAIDEILRWTSPAIHTCRRAAVDVELHGQTIRAGETVAMMLSAANFDPRRFDTPDRLDIARTPNDHLTFGIAEHVCLGMHVARTELKVIFEELLRRVPTIILEGEVAFVRDNLIHGIKKMPMTLSREPSRAAA
jgi:cholest-4-en-3-one 26-monooxygenase